MDDMIDDNRIMKMQLLHLSIPVTDMGFMDNSIHSFKIIQISEKIYDIEVTYYPKMTIFQEYKGVDSISMKGKNKAGDVIINQQFSNIAEPTHNILYNGIETTLLCVKYKCSLVYEN